MKNIIYVALVFLLTTSKAFSFICNLGTCEQQCTSPDSMIGEKPLPLRPDINNGNYVDCMYACIDMKGMFSCADGSEIPWIQGVGDNLDKGDDAIIPIYEKGTFKAYAEAGFTPQDRALLEEAFDIAFEHLGVLFLDDPLNSDFGKCTLDMNYEPYEMADLWGATFWDTNTYGYANIWRRPRLADQRLIRDRPRIKYEVRVVKLWDDSALGRARIGNHSVARPIIALNWNYMKGYRKRSDGELVNDPLYTQAGFWATTIVHELLHTAGFDHQDSIDWNNPKDVAKYKNTFMVYFADCVGEVSLGDIYDPNSKLFLHE
ncbi:MAG: hypothetical protein ACOH5I_26295 [Oligoflexus sp.]